MWETLISLSERYAGVLLALTVLSLASVAVMATLGTRLLARLPADYFVNDARRREHDSLAHYPRVAQVLLPLVKNLAGALFVVTGIVLLVLPGQGVLTLLAGLALMNFPGKYTAERWLVRRRQVRQSIDWIRRRAGQPPLEL
ncbi:MAG: hypothetical protein KDI19_00675 [Pseudomonadales bacterium]|nr:hypothetical protein [Pseudomonadales bacterium]